jgi:hypothetical protein
MKKTSKLSRKLSAKPSKRMTPYERLQAVKRQEAKEEEKRQAEYYKMIRFTSPTVRPEADSDADDILTNEDDLNL